MPEYIEIEGEVVRHVRREIIAVTSLAAASPHLEVQAPSIYPLLPRNTVACAFDGETQRGAVLVEREPERINVSVHFDLGLTGNTPDADFNRAVETAGRGRTAQFNIQLPYLYFLYGFRLQVNRTDGGAALNDFTLDRTNLYMSRDRLPNLTTRLWKAKMMNVQNARICWGYTTHDGGTMANRINHMVNEFPVTLFNNHYGIPLPRGVASLTAWEEGSEADPMYYRGWAHWEGQPDAAPAATLLRDAMSRTEAARLTQLPEPGDWGNILIPQPPQQFTIGRLRQWLDDIPRPLRRRFIEAATAMAADIPATTPEDDYEAFIAATQQQEPDPDEVWDPDEDDEEDDDEEEEAF